jgi:hypothetical protein
MRIEFQQSGGVAGIRRPAVTIDTASLPPEEAGKWHELVTAADFFNLPAASSAGAARDAFSYRITVEADGRRHTIQTHDAAASPSLRLFIDRLRRAGSATPGRSPNLPP